jgi:single-strand DNA-binding protein
MNVAIVSGNLTADIELRYAANGTAVANFTVANNRKWKDQTGAQKEEVSFLGVVAFGKQAEVIAQYFKKGSPILVQGRLKQENWEDKQTHAKRSKTVITLESFEFMGGKREGGDSGFNSAPASRTPAPAAAAPTSNTPEEDSDVPF